MSPPSWSTTRVAFEQAASWFTTTVLAVDGRWDEPGLGGWTVRDLVGHTSRALLTVEAYLDRPATAPEVGSPVEYVVAAMASVGDPAAVARRGRDAGTALGPDPVATVQEVADRVTALVAASAPEAVVATPVGSMALAQYLPTRTFELTVHTCDLATALQRRLDVPEAAAAQTVDLAGALAVRAGLAGPLLLAVTGRTRLDPDFTVL